MKVTQIQQPDTKSTSPHRTHDGGIGDPLETSSENNNNVQTPKSNKRRRTRKRNRGQSNGIGFFQSSSIGSVHVSPTSCPNSTPPDHRGGLESFRHESGSDGVVALDCEMVGVGPRGNQSVLARVAMVDWDGKVILDTFVRVEEKVTDYRTFVSGVRPEDLSSPDAMEFGMVRKTVQKALNNKVLVGHGLVNDLRVLNINHPFHLIRDSAMYEPLLRPNMTPRRLKELAQLELGLLIQREGSPHDPTEDAKASMSIYRRHQINWDWEMSSYYVC